MKFYDAAIRVFELDEGTKERPYKDTNGYWTIGRGHYVGTTLEHLRLPQSVIEELFREDLAIAIREARLVVGNIFFENLPAARQLALVSMLFTLGRDKFLKFDDTIDAMKRYDWDAVADHILNSKWARDVDPKIRIGIGRDDRIAYMFRTGKFHSDYGVIDI